MVATSSAVRIIVPHPLPKKWKKSHRMLCILNFVALTCIWTMANGKIEVHQIFDRNKVLTHKVRNFFDEIFKEISCWGTKKSEILRQNFCRNATLLKQIEWEGQVINWEHCWWMLHPLFFPLKANYYKRARIFISLHDLISQVGMPFIPTRTVISHKLCASRVNFFS